MSAPMEAKVLIGGFTVIPVKFNEKCRTCHHLFLKEDTSHGHSHHREKGKTLLVLNVPPYCTEASLQRLFGKIGKVKQVTVCKKPQSFLPPTKQSLYFNTSQPVTGFKTAYIIFNKDSAVQKAVNLPFGEPWILSTPEHLLVTGMSKWCKEYQYKTAVDEEELQEEINAYMTGYDQRVEEEKQREKEMEGQPDEDGWITVTRHGHNKGVPRTEAQEKRATTKHKRRQKEKELLNFYTFQMQESKKEHIASLQQKFEEDKQRIAAMKAARKFRPY